MTSRFCALVHSLVTAGFLLAAPGPALAQSGEPRIADASASAVDTPDDGSAQARSESRPQRPGLTGRPLPRFASLRADKVNLRTGPGARYPIDWVFQRRGLPVEIIDEFDTWRRIRDWQGTVGWVHQSMLQSQRHVLVTGKRRLLRRGPEESTAGAAYVEAGVVGILGSCQSDWCQVEAKGFKGWLRRDEFYGVYPDE
jgi:SH3-like domain-containing protein